VKTLGKTLHRPTIFPLPEFVVKGILGEMGDELLLGSARAVPEKLQAAGYRFLYNDLDDAMRAALR
jgi:NAD dependent epimerase/dehydratase family enzyme